MTTAPHSPPPGPTQPLDRGTKGEVRHVDGVLKTWNGTTWVLVTRLALGY